MRIRFLWEFSMHGSQDKEVSVHFSNPNADGSLNLSYKTKVQSGRWRLDPETFESLDLLSAASTKKEPAFIYPHVDYPGLQINTVSQSNPDVQWVLRWETLGRNQDRPRDEVPPLSELRLYAIPRNLQ